jgi:hypothetical protein
METQANEDKKWQDRYFVELQAKEAFGYKNVRFQLFQPTMSEPEARKLLKPFGLTKDLSEYDCIVTYVKDTFSLDQVSKMVEYFATFTDTTVCVIQADKPTINSSGVTAWPLGIGSDNHEFCDYENYPLPFKVEGNYSVSGCERTPARTGRSVEDFYLG